MMQRAGLNSPFQKLRIKMFSFTFFIYIYIYIYMTQSDIHFERKFMPLFSGTKTILGHFHVLFCRGTSDVYIFNILLC
jgi:hypothetical protein